MIPRDCPESPLFPGNLTQFEQMERLIKVSDARAQYLESISTVNSTLCPENIRFPLLNDGTGFMVKLGIGSPETVGYFFSWTQVVTSYDAVCTCIEWDQI